MKMFKNDKAGVSPVIATLVLVLVAVAAGVAFFAWQSSWQEESQEGISDPNIKTTIKVGGSTTVYPLMSTAAEAYMLENPSVKISYVGGGSGPGVASVMEGLVDLGMSSSSPTSKLAGNGYVLDEEIDFHYTTVGYDCVAIVVGEGNPHGLLSVDEQTMRNIYEIGTSDVGYTVMDTWDDVPAHTETLTTTQGTPGTTFTISGVGNIDLTQLVAGQPITIEDAVAGTPPTDLSTTVVSSTATTITTADAATVATTDAAVTIMCDGTEAIVTYERSLSSGTEETFGKHIVGTGDELEVAADEGVESNQEMIKVLKSDDGDHAIGFAAFGIADGVVPIVNFDDDGDGVSYPPSSDNAESGDYPYRALYVVWNFPAGQKPIVEDFIEFIKSPGNNPAFTEENGYFSIYDFDTATMDQM